MRLLLPLVLFRALHHVLCLRTYIQHLYKAKLEHQPQTGKATLFVQTPFMIYSAEGIRICSKIR